MKIRLEIAAGEHRSLFEHAGPTVRIGRDPDGELVVKGETGVSRSHVRIDLGPEGAVLRDAGSSNGTLVNDQLIKGPVALAVGDRVALGYTGPKLSVLELDLRPAPDERPHRSIAPWIICAVAFAAVALAVVLIALR